MGLPRDCGPFTLHYPGKSEVSSEIPSQKRNGNESGLTLFIETGLSGIPLRAYIPAP
jgi:hypothetical protein